MTERLLEKSPAPPVPAVIAGPSQTPTPAVRQVLDERLGHDFSGLRLHTDERAGASASALGAEAYTVGRDIVFAPGAFAPHTAPGAQLLAHEATHALQQGMGSYRGGPLVLEAPGSAAEQSAQSRAGAQAPRPHAGGHAAQAVAPASGLRIQRSTGGAVAGGIIGGVVGGVTTGLLGALLGPAGAVAGAILGGIGGAIGGAFLGDLASMRQRPLSGPEREYLHEIFLDSVNYAPVVVVRDSMKAEGAARTTGHAINLQSHHFVGDTMNLSPAGLITLAHEMGHVWQYQHGGLSYIPSSLIPQAVAASGEGRDRDAAYNWRAVARARVPWEQWNAEQQAGCIGDFNEALRATRADAYQDSDAGGRARLRDYETLSMAEPYIALVRQGIGAPGAPRRETGAAGATP